MSTVKSSPFCRSKARVCIVTSDINSIALNAEKLRKVVNRFVNPGSVEEIFITGYSWPTKKSSMVKVYPLVSRNSLKVKFSCAVLKAIDKNIWMPTFVAIPSLWFMRNELVDTIASFDPDIIISTNLRWPEELGDFLYKAFGSCIGLSKKVSSGMMFRLQRNYDPSIKISIVLPTYNGSQYIKKSIESCLNQTHKNIELIIIDDASTDSTPDIIRYYSDERIKYIRHQKNLKLPKSLNTGFEHATGEYFTWTSDDNFYAPDSLEVMLSFLLTYKRVGFVYAGEYAIDENDSITRCDEVRPVKSLRMSNPVGGCFLYSRKVAGRIGKYNSNAFLAEDLDYWIRVSKRFHIIGLRRLLYYRRYHKDSLTTKFSPSKVAEVARLVRKTHKIS